MNKPKIIHVHLSAGKVAIALLGAILDHIAEKENRDASELLKEFIADFVPKYVKNPLEADKAIEGVEEDIQEFLIKEMSKQDVFIELEPRD